MFIFIMFILFMLWLLLSGSEGRGLFAVILMGVMLICLLMTPIGWICLIGVGIALICTESGKNKE
jgi:hypothetical protein